MNVRRKFVLFVLLGITVAASVKADGLFTTRDFINPPMAWRPVPLWFWNNAAVEGSQLESDLRNMVEQDRYGGCAILPFGENFRPSYLSEDYFSLYGRAVAKAQELGAQMSLYDEYGFPSGSMGAINGNGVTTFMNNHPGKTIKRLDKVEYALSPGRKFTLDLRTIPGTLMAVAGYSAVKKYSISLRPYIQNGVLTWTPPLSGGYGRWTLMVFTCVVDGDPNVDYLDADAVRLFVEDTHGQYYKHFPEAFGKTITSTFFDEPTLYRAQGRIWTDSFNEKFVERYGFQPDSLYPALWYDLGDQTPAARNMLFGLRAQLYAEGFMKTIADWATEHGILSTGHQDQEEIQNPTSVAGDLMLDGKYMTMPGIDKIGGGRPTENFYKVVSSSANNWDHPQVMSETYGAMGNISMELMYQVAIDQYTKGITNLIPHAVWYNDKNVTFLPELSWRNPLYNQGLRGFNTFLSRLRYVLARPSQHVADIAVLYPIHTLQAGHTLDGALGYYEGGVKVAGTDYDHISALLTDELGRDFTYLHPEVLDDRCSVDKDGVLTMSNPINTEHFNTIILPGIKVISRSNLLKIEEAWKGGAMVIFTTQLPKQSADPSATDEEIQAVVSRMLESETAVFVESPSASTLRAALAKSKVAADVSFQTSSHPFNYIHKVVEGRHVYYFGNIDGTQATCTIHLRENLSSAYWMDPRTGTVKQAELTRADGGTEVELTLLPSQSSFLIEGDAVEQNGGEAENPTTGYSYEIEMKVQVDRLSAGICFSGLDANNYNMWQINLEQPSNPRLRPHQWMNGSVSVLADISFGDKVRPSVGKAMTVRIVVLDESVAQTYIDGVLIDTRYGNFKYGKIGFREDHSDQYGQIEAARFDDICIRDGKGRVLYTQDFSSTNPFSSGVIQGGWLRVTGSMNGASYAWQQDYQQPTAIQTIHFTPKDRIYTLQGIPVARITSPGLYVVNGMKMVY